MKAFIHLSFIVVVSLSVGNLKLYADTSMSQGVEGSIMPSGARLMDSAASLKTEADKAILRSNIMRNAIKRHRQQQNELDSSSAKKVLEEMIQQQVKDSIALQQMGSRLRAHSLGLQQEAMQILKSGLSADNRQWLTNPLPLQIEPPGAHNEIMAVRAHNTQMRSVHPKMNEMVKNPDTYQQENMSLLMSSVALQPMPSELNMSSFSVSRDRKYFAHIEVEQQTDDDTGFVKINQMQSWRLILTRLQGEPVQNANISFGGHMPGHVHGLPTQPRITTELAAGVYRISGVKFQMQGWWVIDLTVSEARQGDNAITDVIRFNLAL